MRKIYLKINISPSEKPLTNNDRIIELERPLTLGRDILINISRCLKDVTKALDWVGFDPYSLQIFFHLGESITTSLTLFWMEDRLQWEALS